MMRLFSTIIFAAAVSMVPAMQAGSLGVPCKVDTLANYQLIGEHNECSVGIENFFYFNFAATGDAVSPETASDILLDPVANGFGGSFTFCRVNPSMSCPTDPTASEGVPAFSVQAGEKEQYVLAWQFVIDPGPVGAGADIGMDPPFGDVTITQQYCLDSVFVTLGNSIGCSRQAPIQQLEVDNTNPPTSWKDHITFDPPATSDGQVRTVISLDGTGPSGAAGFDNATSSQIVNPEPASIALALTGLIGLAARRKFKPVS